MSYLPTTYQPAWGQQMYPNMQTAMSQAPQNVKGIEWVDGEVGAKAFQMPAGWPANTPIALWDTNDTVIYLKSINAMGMPNPLQIAHYQLEERIPHKSGRSEDYTEQSWSENFRNELDAIKKELEELKDLKGEKK